MAAYSLKRWRGATAVTGEVVARSSGSANTDPFVGVIAHRPIKPGTVTITLNETTSGIARTATDDGAGNLAGTGVAAGGTVNYTTGAISLATSSNDVSDSTVRAAYSYNGTEIATFPDQAQSDAAKAKCVELEAGLPAYPERGTMMAVYMGRDILDGDTFTSAPTQ